MGFSFIVLVLTYIIDLLKCCGTFTLVSARSNGAPSFLLHQSALAPRSGMGSKPDAEVCDKSNQIFGIEF